MRAFAAILFLLGILGVLGASVPQEAGQEGPPFSFELPAGYRAFAPRPGSLDSWASLRSDGSAQFLVDHWLAENPGALPEAVARYRRTHLWQANLQGVAHEARPWSGQWAGHRSAGTEITLPSEAGARFLVERVLVLEDHLVIATWEGPESARAEALAALDSLGLPAAWLPGDPLDFDPTRGAGDPPAMLLLAPGTLELELDLGQLTEEYLELRAALRPDAAPRTGPWTWVLPGDAACSLTPGQAHAELTEGGRVRVSPDADGVYRLAWRFQLDEHGNELAHLGLHFGPSALAVLEPAWLAWPEQPDLPGGAVTEPLPPAWSLSVRLPAPLSAVSAAPPLANELEEGSGTRLIRFPQVPAGRSWPFVLVGMFQEKTVADRTAWLRLGSDSSAPDAALRLLERLASTLEDWMPAVDGSWAVATFPGAGDWVLPGLLLLDEERGWLSAPLDAPWEGVTRGAGLARLVAARAFGLQLRGSGGAAAFLEHSFAEYSAWRLLEAVPRGADTRALEAFWRQREAAAAPLRRPLSTLPRSDAAGPQRLLSRGAPVLRALEQAVGRQQLDAVLRQFLADAVPWNAEQLRRALEQRSGKDWGPWFDRHVYGRQPPGD